jgi:RimJ/RimL family protein N-acetyltransferase
VATVDGVFDVPVLEGSRVLLVPLEFQHAADLTIAAEEDRRTFAFTRVPRAGEVTEYVQQQLDRRDQGRLAPFAQIRRSDLRAVGCTAYWDPRYWPDRDELCAVEIGWTWLSASAQRTGINVESKLLLFTHAFEALGVARVDLKTDARNERSKKAIALLGATFEGTLRQWSPSHAPGEQGRLRDSAMFSVIASEWPVVQSTLMSRLARIRG